MESVMNSFTENPRELLLVFAAVFLTVYVFYRRRRISYSGCKLPPAVMSLPIVGSLPFLGVGFKDFAEFSISPRNKLGKIFSFRLGPKYVIMVNGKKAIREALVMKSLDFADRIDFILERSKGIVFARYDSTFKAHRQLCLSILKRFGFGQSVMETRILIEVEEMIKRVREKQGRPFDIKELTTSCVVNVIMSMMFGHRFDHSDPAFQQLISDFHDFSANILSILWMFPVLRFLPYFKKKYAKCRAENIDRFFNSHIAACTETDKKTESFVSYFIESHKGDYDTERLLCTLFDLVGAAMETTMAFICWAIVILTNHVSVQERLHAEIDFVIGRQRLPTLDDRARLPYVEATILELSRYKTVAPLAAFHRTLKDTELGGYFIPGDTLTLVNLYSVHMDPDDWQQPQLFRPERFLDESGNVVDKDKVMPFSLGKRSCLGEQLARQEMFLFLASLLQNFDFKPPEGQDSIVVHERWGASMSPSDFEVRMLAREA